MFSWSPIISLIGCGLVQVLIITFNHRLSLGSILPHPPPPPLHHHNHHHCQHHHHHVHTNPSNKHIQLNRHTTPSETSTQSLCTLWRASFNFSAQQGKCDDDDYGANSKHLNCYIYYNSEGDHPTSQIHKVNAVLFHHHHLHNSTWEHYPHHI